MKSRPGDYVGMRYQDDLDLCEMIDCSRLPPGTEDPEGEGMIHILQEAIPREHLPPHNLPKERPNPSHGFGSRVWFAGPRRALRPGLEGGSRSLRSSM